MSHSTVPGGLGRAPPDRGECQPGCRVPADAQRHQLPGTDPGIGAGQPQLALEVMAEVDADAVMQQQLQTPQGLVLASSLRRLPRSLRRRANRSIHSLRIRPTPVPIAPPRRRDTSRCCGTAAAAATPERIRWGYPQRSPLESAAKAPSTEADGS